MTWTALTDKTTGTLITAAHWNLMMGVTGNLAESAPAKVTTAGDMLVATGANALARLAAVATGSVLSSQGVGVAPAWVAAAAAAEPPWSITVLFTDYLTNTNWNAASAATATLYGGYLASTGAQNAEVSWPLVLAAGTWTVRLVYGTGNNHGIHSIQFDAVEKGTVDAYSVSVANSVISDVTGIVVATTAKVVVKLKMATKNASSSNYFGIIEAVHLRRTA